MAEPINPSNPPPTPIHTTSTQQENQGLNHHLQPNQSHYISMNNELPSYSTTLEQPPTPSTSIAAPHQFHGSLSTFFEQFLGHIARQSLPPPPPPPPPGPTQPQQLNPSGSFNFKVEPILLHINSSVPLLNHDQLNSSKTISESNIPPKQEPQQPPKDVIPPPPPLPPPESELVPQKINPVPQQINPPGEGGGVPPPASNNYRKRHQTALTKAGSLANLLPTGTVLAFQALTPSLSDGGECRHLTNKVLLGVVVTACTIICFFSTLTDSVCCNQKLYYGIASPKGLLVFNYENRAEEEPNVEKEAKNLKLQPTDLVHGFLSVAVFLIFAFSSSELQGCFFPRESEETQYSMVVYLPLVAGILSSFLFTIFPTTRKGIGYTPTN